jgi:hypothetical protein
MMMIVLMSDLDMTTMNSIEISFQIVGGIGSGWNVLGDFNVSPLFH